MRARETELRHASTARPTTLADDLDEGDEVLVDGRPVEPGQVIVLEAGPRSRRRSRSSTGMSDTLVAELGAALSPDRVRVGETELALYKRDASNLDGHAGVVCFPTTTDEVQACVAHCQFATVGRSSPVSRHRPGRRGDAARRRRS